MISLSRRESEVLNLLAQGRTSLEISEKIFLSLHTVEWHRKKLLKKFNVSNTTLLLIKANEKGLLSIGPVNLNDVVKHKKLNIVLADDNESEQVFFRQALRLFSEHNLKCVQNGMELLNYLKNSANKKLPDLIFLDLHMPQMDGEEVLENLKKDPILKSIPVYIYAASTTPELTNKFYKMGASLFVKKSPDFKKVSVVVQSICNLFDDIVKYPT